MEKELNGFIIELPDGRYLSDTGKPTKYKGLASFHVVKTLAEKHAKEYNGKIVPTKRKLKLRG